MSPELFSSGHLEDKFRLSIFAVYFILFLLVFFIIILDGNKVENPLKSISPP